MGVAKCTRKLKYLQQIGSFVEKPGCEILQLIAAWWPSYVMFDANSGEQLVCVCELARILCCPPPLCGTQHFNESH